MSEIVEKTIISTSLLQVQFTPPPPRTDENECKTNEGEPRMDVMNKRFQNYVKNYRIAADEISQRLYECNISD